MATGEIVPSGDSFIEWLFFPAEGTHASKIDEDHGSPDENDYITANQVGAMDDDIDDFHMSSIIGVGEVTQVVIHTYCKKNTTYGGNCEVDFYDGNNWRGYQSVAVFYVVFGWEDNTFGSLSMNQTDLDNCRVRYRADLPDTKMEVHIATVYAVVTYTAPTGYGHDFIGIPAANIDSIMGIPTENIESISGL